MGEENMNPAGLGSKLYFCRAEDFEKYHDTPMQEVKLTSHVGGIAFMNEDGQQEGENGLNDKGGFSFTATASIEATPVQQKLIRRLTQGQGRLPRHRKKQVLKRVLRYDSRIIVVAFFLVNPMYGRDWAFYLIARLMFPDKVCGKGLVINEAEYHTAFLCLKRIEKKYRKYIQTSKGT